MKLDKIPKKFVLKRFIQRNNSCDLKNSLINMNFHTVYLQKYITNQVIV